MSDLHHIEDKKKEIEELFATVGFSFDQYELQAFENACDDLSEKGVECHSWAETTEARAKITTQEGVNYQISYDGANLEVS